MIQVNGKQVKVGNFPNKESFVDVNYIVGKMNYMMFKFEGNEEFIYLKFIVDDIKIKGGKIELTIPYLPYSRMDRQEEKRIFSLRSISDFINSLNVDKVIVWEPHSEVTSKLIKRLEIRNTTAELAKKFMKENKLDGLFLVYPDDGAVKRYKGQIDYEDVIEMKKKRDFNTGKIIDMEISNAKNINKCNTAIIIDDLCSRGGTFMMTAKLLKEHGVNDIYLVVTHCEDTIFDGDILKTDYIKKVITTNSILSKKHEKIDLNKINYI